MTLPYSITGLINVLYRRNIISVLTYSKDLRIIPRSLFAFAAVVEQCS